MSYAFNVLEDGWVEISPAGTLAPGAGEFGEDIVVSDGFIASLSAEARAERGFVEVVETAEPEGSSVIGWTVEDLEGLPTRVWITA